MASGGKKSVVCDPDPDTHYKPEQLPCHVREPVAECLMHSTEVIRRGVTRRTKLATTLDGSEWDIRTTPTFFLHCPRCGERQLQSIYFKEDANQVGVYCCTRCIEWCSRWGARAKLPGKKWKRFDHTDYNKRPRGKWTNSEARTYSLVNWANEQDPSPATVKSYRRRGEPVPQPPQASSTPQENTTKKLRAALNHLISVLNEVAGTNVPDIVDLTSE